ncbi:MAG: lipocalin family protein [Paraprevotella sp.]|nr:lipocalin family protein [Paraprevotella sp.]
MKKFLFMLAVLTACFSFSSCGDDGDGGFDYPMSTLYGTWTLTHVQENGIWVNVVSGPYALLGGSVTFYEDGKYAENSNLGITVTGTYKASGKTIVCYVSGSEFGRYKVTKLQGGKMEGVCTVSGGVSRNIKAEKR